jgi:orotate phosphoribosyltransferase
VITAGTAIRESVDIIQAAGAAPAGVLLALDRQERGSSGAASAVQEVRQQFGIPVISVIGLDTLLQYMQERSPPAEFSSMVAYRERYGV